MAQAHPEQRMLQLGNVVENDGTEFPEEELLLAEKDPKKVVTSRPSTLGYASMIFIIVNRMIGKPEVWE